MVIKTPGFALMKNGLNMGRRKNRDQQLVVAKKRQSAMIFCRKLARLTVLFAHLVRNAVRFPVRLNNFARKWE